MLVLNTSPKGLKIVGAGLVSVTYACFLHYAQLFKKDMLKVELNDVRKRS